MTLQLPANIPQIPTIQSHKGSIEGVLGGLVERFRVQGLGF